MKLVRDKYRGGHRYWFFCPGCKHAHSYTVGCGITGQNWQFDAATLSFSPSLLSFIPRMTIDCHHCDGTGTHGTEPNPCSHCKGGKVDRPQETTCHLFVKNGKIEFCGDCPHDHNGKTVDLPEFPEGYGISEPFEIVA